MDYYEILELEITCTKKDIKKKYRLLCLKYHPDKNNGNDTKFKDIKEAYDKFEAKEDVGVDIKEAYDVLIDDEKRKLYNIQRIFKNIDFTEDDYQLLQKYYHQLIDSNEFKLMQLLYQSIPSSIKKEVWNRFKKQNCKTLVKSQKTIDITRLNNDISINLIVSDYDKQRNTLKIIHILTKNGIYYLYLRDFNDLVINNLDCSLFINFL